MAKRGYSGGLLRQLIFSAGEDMFRRGIAYSFGVG